MVAGNIIALFDEKDIIRVLNDRLAGKEPRAAEFGW
jgi:hypothetical protein